MRRGFGVSSILELLELLALLELLELLGVALVSVHEYVYLGSIIACFFSSFFFNIVQGLAHIVMLFFLGMVNFIFFNLWDLVDKS